MKLIDSNPFVRWALQFEFTPDKAVYASLDCRLFYIVNGEGDIIINENKYHLSKFTMLLWPAYTEYQFLCDSPIDVISVNFDYDRTRARREIPFHPIRKSYAGAPVMGLHDNVFFEDVPSLNRPLVCYDAEGFKALQTIISELNAKRPFSDEKSSSLLKSVIVDILRKSGASASQPSTTYKLEEVMKYIHTHYMEEITNEELAQIVNYHPNYLNRIFLKTNGITIHQYIIKYRITIAEQQLISTNLPIAEISEKVGFSCVVSFTSNFRKINGILPSEYRKRLKN